MTIKELIKHLETYKPDEIIAYDLWSVDDVMEEGNHHDDYPEVTQEQAEEVLLRMGHNKDCNVGLNWDYMNYHLDNVMYEAEQKGGNDE